MSRHALIRALTVHGEGRRVISGSAHCPSSSRHQRGKRVAHLIRLSDKRYGRAVQQSLRSPPPGVGRLGRSARVICVSFAEVR